MNERALETTRPRAVLAVLGALVCAVPIMIGLTIGGSARSSAATISSQLSPVAANLPATPTPQTLIPSGPGALVALLQRPTTLRTRPGGARLAHLYLRTQFGSPTVMWVRRTVPGWLGVVTPQAGNNRIGWIPA